jgi:sugar phosphate isomerase/epimerase
MRISLITDEISADPETAFELGLEWGVRYFEIRGIGENRVPLISDYQKDHLIELIANFSIRIVAVSPGLFKIPYPIGLRSHFPLQVIDAEMHQRWRDARDLVKYHCEELLPISLEFASRIGAKIVSIFSFHRGHELPGQAPQEVLEAISQAASLAEEKNLVLGIEVEEGFWADTGSRTAEIVKTINSSSLGVTWDPANAVAAGDIPYPDGYQAAKQFIRHVHFKDLIHDQLGNLKYAISGEVDWEGQIHALKEDGYQGFISVEPHMQPKVVSARMMTKRLQELLNSVGRQ